MPRQGRIDMPGALHHIICRGIERREIFADDVDRDDFLSRLIELTTVSSTRCFAWALIPNHLHLLLQTGNVSISSLMQKLLGGYATTFNLRHGRSGHLFQNRYKSILCQEEVYLLELVRYIHLNPLRAGLVPTLEALSDYRYCGHGCMVGRNPDLESWMPTAYVLERFSNRLGESRRAYEAFVLDGVAMGRRQDLTGGGLRRSVGGWRQLRSARDADMFFESDERILGDSDFVRAVLQSAEDRFEKSTRYRMENVDFERLVLLVADVLEMEAGEVGAAGKQPHHVRARSLLCFWAVREIGMTEVALARLLQISQPAVAQAVSRGERLAGENGWDLQEVLDRNL